MLRQREFPREFLVEIDAPAGRLVPLMAASKKVERVILNAPLRSANAFQTRRIAENPPYLPPVFSTPASV